MCAGKVEVSAKKTCYLEVLGHPLGRAATSKSKRKKNPANQPAPPFYLTLPHLVRSQPSHLPKNYPKVTVYEMGKFTQNLPGKKWVKVCFRSVRSTFQGESWRKGLDERLSEAVGVSTLAGDHQNVARLDSIAEIAVSPDIVRGA